MEFQAFLNGKKQKTFKGNVMNTIYTNFNTYCKNRGYRQLVNSPDSFGNVAWSNGQEVIIFVRIS